MRIRYVRLELPFSTITESADGFLIPDLGPGWTPFQIDTERISPQAWYGGPRPSQEDRVVVEVWLHEDES